jgi:hypothetical protein
LNVVLGTNQLTAINGAETYLITVAEQLQRLGHPVTLYGLELGEMAEFARKRGLPVTSRGDDLPESCDALLVNDVVAAYTLAERYETTPQVFVAHAAGFLFCTPPQLPEVTSAVVALNDRVAARLRALALAPELVRLRQPIDIARFDDTGAPRARARRVLLLGNYLRGEHRDLLAHACDTAGLEWTQIGAHGTATPEPELAIADADIVVGHGRAILEAMASGRPAYVFDHGGADGWVTPSRYPAMESDGFAGQRHDARVYDLKRLSGDLAAYRPEMGRENRDLARKFHRAGEHAAQLVALFGRLPPRRARPDDRLDEMARLAAAEWRALSRAHQLRTGNQMLRAELHAAESRVQELELQLQELHELRSYVTELKGTRRYRTMARLVRPLDAFRRLRHR